MQHSTLCFPSPSYEMLVYRTSQHPKVPSQSPQTFSKALRACWALDQLLQDEMLQPPHCAPQLVVAHCSTSGAKSGRRVWMIFGRGWRGLSSWSLSSGAELSPCSSSQTWTTTLGVVGVAVWSSYFSPGNHKQKNCAFICLILSHLYRDNYIIHLLKCNDVVLSFYTE